jgi:hypothetical protein
MSAPRRWPSWKRTIVLSGDGQSSIDGNFVLTPGAKLWRDELRGPTRRAPGGTKSETENQLGSIGLTLFRLLSAPVRSVETPSLIGGMRTSGIAISGGGDRCLHAVKASTTPRDDTTLNGRRESVFILMGNVRMHYLLGHDRISACL